MFFFLFHCFVRFFVILFSTCFLFYFLFVGVCLFESAFCPVICSEVLKFAGGLYFSL